MKKIVIATDSFKESMSGLEVATHIETGFKTVFPSCSYVKLAMADGGEGTVQSLVLSTDGTIELVDVTNPLGKEIQAPIGFDKDESVAYIEMAAASGLELLSNEERNPLLTNTRGTGQLIKKALDRGVKHIIIGIGGSATNDCGIGMANALGAKFIDKDGKSINPIADNLDKIVDIDLSNFDRRVFEVEIEVACDVDNKMYGENGASKIFGPQKGATKEIVEKLEVKMISFAKVLEKKYQKDPQQLVGGGAAGALGVGLNFFCNGKLRSGVKIVSDFLNLENHIKDADLVITGEGRIDSQSINGKAPIGVAKVASKYNVDCIAICGSVDPSAVMTYDYGIKSVFSVMLKPQSLEQAFIDCGQNLEMTSQSIARILSK